MRLLSEFKAVKRTIDGRKYLICIEEPRYIMLVIPSRGESITKYVMCTMVDRLGFIDKNTDYDILFNDGYKIAIRRVYFERIMIHKLIVPDKKGKFPWDKGCDIEYAEQWTAGDALDNEELNKENIVEKLRICNDSTEEDS